MISKTRMSKTSGHTHWSRQWRIVYKFQVEFLGFLYGFQWKNLLHQFIPNSSGFIHITGQIFPTGCSRESNNSGQFIINPWPDFSGHFGGDDSCTKLNHHLGWPFPAKKKVVEYLTPEQFPLLLQKVYLPRNLWTIWMFPKIVGKLPPNHPF